MTDSEAKPKLTIRQKLAAADLSFFAYFGARILSGVAGVVMLRFLVTLLDKSEYAQWGYFRTIGIMLVPVLTLSLPAAMMRMYFDRAEDDTAGQRKLITTVMWLICVSAAIEILGALGFYFLGGETGAFVVFFCLVAPAGIFISFFDYLTRVRNNYGIYTINRVMESAGFALLLWLSITYSDERVSFTGDAVTPLMWTIILYTVCLWSVLLGNLVFYIRRGLIKPFGGILGGAEIRALIKFSAPLTGTYFLGWALNSADIYILDKLSDPDQVADYIFAVGVAAFVSMVTSAALNDWPRFYYAAMRDDKADRDEAIAQRIRLYLMIHIGAIVAVRLIAGLAYDLLNAEDYKNGVVYIDYLILGNFFFLSGNIAAAGIGYVKKTHLTLVTFALPGVLNVGLNIWLIPTHGALAASMTTLGAFFVFALTSFAIGRRYYAIQGMGRIALLVLLASALALTPLPF